MCEIVRTSAYFFFFCRIGIEFQMNMNLTDRRRGRRERWNQFGIKRNEEASNEMRFWKHGRTDCEEIFEQINTETWTIMQFPKLFQLPFDSKWQQTSSISIGISRLQLSSDASIFFCSTFSHYFLLFALISIASENAVDDTFVMRLLSLFVMIFDLVTHVITAPSAIQCVFVLTSSWSLLSSPMCFVAFSDIFSIQSFN